MSPIDQPTPAPEPPTDHNPFTERRRRFFIVESLPTPADVDEARDEATFLSGRLETALDALHDLTHRWSEDGDGMDANMVIALSTLIAIASEDAGRTHALLDHAQIAAAQLAKGGAA